MQHSDTMKTVLWLSAHPEAGSLNGSLRRDGIAHLRKVGHEVLESDLYAMDWDPVMRHRDGGRETSEHFRVTEDTRNSYLDNTQTAEVREEQAKLRKADAVVVQFPLWWYGMPAILKGWFDRVFVSGFAFGKEASTGKRLRFEQGPFAGKVALAATTLGDRPRAIGPRGKSGELHELLFGLLHGTFAYTGMNVLTPWALPGADRIVDYEPVRNGFIRRLDGLFTDAPIRYRPQFTGDYTSEWELEAHVRPGESGLSIHIDDDGGVRNKPRQSA